VSSTPTLKVSCNSILDNVISSPAFNQRTLSPNVIFTSTCAVVVTISQRPFESVVSVTCEPDASTDALSACT